MSYQAYLWVKFIHYCGFISWMAVLFYLPRLYVYHAENLDKPEFIEVCKYMEKMLFHAIGWIALLLTLLSGIIIIVGFNPGLLKDGFMHVKLLFATLLIMYHFLLWYYLIKFQNDECTKSGKYFRIINEIPTLIMFGILYAMIIMRYQ